MGVSNLDINEWFTGKSVPERRLLIKIFRYTKSDAKTVYNIMKTFGYDISNEELDTFPSGVILHAAEYPSLALTGEIDWKPTFMSGLTNINSAIIQNETAREIQDQLLNLQIAVENLSERASQEKNSADNMDNGVVPKGIDDIKKAIEGLQVTSQQLTAPVRMPAPEAMEVTLLPATYVARLEEYRSEESQWFAWFGVFFGSIIGVFVNVATGGELKKEAWILLGVFLAMSLLTLYFAVRAKRNGNNLRERLLGPKS